MVNGVESMPWGINEPLKGVALPVTCWPHCEMSMGNSGQSAGADTKFPWQVIMSTHAELLQNLPLGQMTPHPPQLTGSVLVGTHWFPQSEKPVAHTHEPPLQLCPVAHPLPQVPQLSGSVYVFVQVPPQSDMFEPQLHAWLVHVPPPQPWPHAPQLSGSFVRLAHELPQ
jgi:hypothetical protein